MEGQAGDARPARGRLRPALSGRAVPPRARSPARAVMGRPHGQLKTSLASLRSKPGFQKPGRRITRASNVQRPVRTLPAPMWHFTYWSPRGKHRGSVGVVAIGDTADRMTEDLDRRLGHVLVVVRRTGLAQVLELPGLLLSGLDIQLELDASEAQSSWKRTLGRDPPPRKRARPGPDSRA